MSLGSEMLMELIIEEAVAEAELKDEYMRLKAIFEAGFWITKERKTVKISNMTGNHIRNSIKMIERNIQDEIYSYLEEELADIALANLKQELKKRYPPLDPAFMWG